MTFFVRVTFVFFIVLSFVFIATTISFAVESTDKIEATVKVGICGNNIAEENEDCDTDDLKGVSCITLGHDSGTLLCNTDCSYNKLNCSNDSNSNDDKESDKQNRSFDSGFEAFSNIINDIRKSFITPIIRPIYDIPINIVFYDTNGDGKLHKKELNEVVGRWISFIKADNKKKDCDINLDSKCDLVDFSILMYYVEPS